MKRIRQLCLALLLGLATNLRAEDAAEYAAALAARKEAEETIKRLTATVETLLEAQQALQKRLAALTEEINILREDQTRAKLQFITRDEYTRLLTKIEEIEKKRESDKDLVLKSFEELKKLAKPPALAAPERKHPPESAPETPEGIYYTVKERDRLLDIIKAYNDDFKSQGKPAVTMDQILKANPNLKPDHVLPGQKILIPLPGGK